MIEKNYAGLDGFVWWMGVVESRKDPLELGRCQVRVFGWHTENLSDIPSEDLPWATPINSLNTQSFTTPKEADFVFGFFADGKNAQVPLIMGIIPHFATKGSDPKIGFNDIRDSSEVKNSPKKVKKRKYSRTGGGVKLSEESSERYPRRKDLRNPSTTGLARNKPSKSNVVSSRKEREEISIPSTDKETFDTPKPSYAPVYPYNQAMETESGHSLEFDDTPGAERVELAHRSGTMFEIQPNGTKIEEIVKDNYRIVMADDYVYIMGKAVVSVDSQCLVKIAGNVKMEVGGDFEIKAAGDVKISAGKQLKMDAGKTTSISGQSTKLVSRESTSISGTKVSVSSTGSTEISSSDLSLSSRGTTSITGTEVSSSSLSVAGGITAGLGISAGLTVSAGSGLSPPGGLGFPSNALLMTELPSLPAIPKLPALPPIPSISDFIVIPDIAIEIPSLDQITQQLSQITNAIDLAEIQTTLASLDVAQLDGLMEVAGIEGVTNIVDSLGDSFNISNLVENISPIGVDSFIENLDISSATKFTDKLLDSIGSIDQFVDKLPIGAVEEFTSKIPTDKVLQLTSRMDSLSLNKFVDGLDPSTINKTFTSMSTNQLRTTFSNLVGENIKTVFDSLKQEEISSILSNLGNDLQKDILNKLSSVASEYPIIT